MLLALTLVSPDAAASDAAAARVSQAVIAAGGRVKPARRLAPGVRDIALDLGAVADARAEALRAGIEAAVADLPVDACLQPASGRRKRLLVADMDSTIIGCECLDELADYAGLKAEIAAVTERAMRGELDFAVALRERVAKLAGLPLPSLGACLAERVRLNPGGRTLVRTMAAHGAHTVLVTGGFEAFAAPVAAMAGFDGHEANRLIDDGERLTGAVADPILGREAKLATLQTHAAALGLGLDETLAVGDGANDLAMIEAAGLGVAYYAKPLVAARADARIAHSDLSALLYFQGYDADAFVQDGP